MKKLQFKVKRFSDAVREGYSLITVPYAKEQKYIFEAMLRNFVSKSSTERDICIGVNPGNRFSIFAKAETGTLV
jgi:hypothetical protein